MLKMNLGKRTQREKKFMKGKWSVAHVILMWAPNSPMFGFGDWGLLGTDNILHFLYVLAFYLWKSFRLNNDRNSIYPVCFKSILLQARMRGVPNFQSQTNQLSPDWVHI